MGLSLNEWVSTLEIIIAILCIPAVVLLSYVIQFPKDMHMFFYQCSLTTTMVLCLIFALRVWFYESKQAKTRRHVQTFCVVVLWIMFIFGLVMAILFDTQYTGKLIYDVFDPAIFDDLDLTLLYVAMIVGIIVLVLLFIVNVIITISVCMGFFKREE
ncbi:uncharacterized protein LOC101453270 [Ceratitis capitata]|uniref:uncharacterized protein LOC101453270 n=1 Tax=Ceratitis capitata TaxID=7213 RepID=UPI000618946F|nr:uncharacterized protein LOC101453270 [Ceratitis capitata]